MKRLYLGDLKFYRYKTERREEKKEAKRHTRKVRHALQMKSYTRRYRYLYCLFFWCRGWRSCYSRHLQRRYIACYIPQKTRLLVHIYFSVYDDYRSGFAWIRYRYPHKRYYINTVKSIQFRDFDLKNAKNGQISHKMRSKSFPHCG